MTTNKQIWVVEDDPEIRELLALLLNQHGYAVTTFENAVQFTKALQSGQAMDALLLDVMLPDGNGNQLCQRVRNHPNFGQVPILMMSANMTFPEVVRFCRGDDFINKPFDFNLILRKLEQLLQSNSA